MEVLTLSMSLLVVVITLTTRPVFGLIAYLGTILLYPDYLRISIGTVDISASRIAVCILLCRCLADARVCRAFHWTLLDALVVLSMVVYALALACTTPFSTWLEERGGFTMDTLFAYAAARLVLVDRTSFVTVIKASAVMTMLVAIHAVFECFTGRSIYMGLGWYCPFAPGKGCFYQTRYELFRAMGPCGETLMFGLSCAALVPLFWLLRHEPGPWKQLAYPFAGAGIIGAAATVSSGPYLVVVVSLACLALERAKALAKALLILFILGCICVELISYRHFYYVLGDFTMDGESAWYRARLIDVAIARLPEYWPYGYGLRDPGWGPEIDGRSRSDGVNDFVVQAVLYGVFGLAAYCAVLAAGMHGLVRTHASTRSAWVKSCSWAFGSALVGVIAALWSVSLFGQMLSVFYFLLGALGALNANCRAAVRKL
jgi:hypothetical protein